MDGQDDHLRALFALGQDELNSDDLRALLSDDELGTCSAVRLPNGSLFVDECDLEGGYCVGSPACLRSMAVVLMDLLERAGEIRRPDPRTGWVGLLAAAPFKSGSQAISVIVGWSTGYQQGGEPERFECAVWIVAEVLHHDEYLARLRPESYEPPSAWETSRYLRVLATGGVPEALKTPLFYRGKGVSEPLLEIARGSSAEAGMPDWVREGVGAEGALPA